MAQRRNRGKSLAAGVGACVASLFGSPIAVAAPTLPSADWSWVLQGLLLVIALFLSWLLWRVWSLRRRQEKSLLGEIREREERLNLALWGSGDEFWDWN